MITIREFRDDELKNVNYMLRQGEIKFKKPTENELVYIALDDKETIGLVKVKEVSDIWTLKYIYIHEDWRNNKIGDGLLRVILDKLDKRGIKTLYFYGDDQYLIKSGFIKNEDNVLELDIEKFFKRKSCCGNANEL